MGTSARSVLLQRVNEPEISHESPGGSAPGPRPTQPLGPIATIHPHAVPVLQRLRLDFCCGGARSLVEACATRGLAPQRSLHELIDHIVARHHRPLDAQLPSLERAVALGHVWLGVAGGLALWLGPQWAGPLYDAQLHAVFVGFVLSMILGQAPVVFPSVLVLPLRYRPVLTSSRRRAGRVSIGRRAVSI